MRSVSRLLIAAVSVLAACTDLPSESMTRSSVITPNRITVNRITVNRITVNRLPASRLISTRLANGQMTVNMESAGKLLATEDGPEIFSLIVSCAMPPDVTIVADVGGVPRQFFGDLGLALEWVTGPLSSAGQGWVSACMFARLNVNEVAIPISIRGPNPALQASPLERDIWRLEEGAFFGNFFTPIDQPIEWYACRGAGQASGEFGDLIDRDCTEPDPANPGLTMCGFNYAGDCGTFASDHSCDQFSGNGTFYAQCHALGKPSHEVFHQVITSYVIP
jgi:hypothetical protein